MTEVLDQLLSWVRDLDPALRTLVAGLGMLLETSVLVGLIVPGDSIALIASTGVTSLVEYLALVAALVAGAIAGESIGFGLGRAFGPALRRGWLGRRVGERNWQLAERYLGKRGGIAVFLSRFLPVLHSLVPITAAMSGMRYRRFLAWTVPACLIWAFSVVTLGYGAAVSFEELSGRVKWAGYAVIGGVLLAIALGWLGKRAVFLLERRHLRAEPAAPAESAGPAGPAAARDEHDAA